MLSYRCIVAAVCGACVLGAALGADPATGEDFRVENKVFLGARQKPASQSTTIFHDGVVYDYMKEPPEVIVLDQEAGRFILLDMVRRVRAELTTDDVAGFVRQLREAAAKHPDPVVHFLADPKFEEHFDESSNKLTLSSPWMTYRLLLKQTGKQVASQYRSFSDWYARLNAMLKPGARPPTARLLVNAALEDRRATAKQVELTITATKGLFARPITLRSEHELIDQVAGADLDRIAQTRQFLDIFKPVSFEQYVKSAHQ